MLGHTRGVTKPSREANTRASALPAQQLGFSSSAYGIRDRSLTFLFISFENIVYGLVHDSRADRRVKLFWQSNSWLSSYGKERRRDALCHHFPYRVFNVSSPNLYKTTVPFIFLKGGPLSAFEPPVNYLMVPVLKLSMTSEFQFSFVRVFSWVRRFFSNQYLLLK